MMRPVHRLSARRVPLLGLLVGLCLAGTCLGPVLISDSQERELGLTLVGELEGGENFTPLGDPEVDAYINEVAGRIIQASPLQRSFPFTFKVIVYHPSVLHYTSIATVNIFQHRLRQSSLQPAHVAADAEAAAAEAAVGADQPPTQTPPLPEGVAVSTVTQAPGGNGQPDS